MSSSIYNLDDPVWLAKAKGAFQTLDENKDGIVDYKEAMKRLLRYKEISKSEEVFKCSFSACQN